MWQTMFVAKCVTRVRSLRRFSFAIVTTLDLARCGARSHAIDALRERRRRVAQRTSSSREEPSQRYACCRIWPSSAPRRRSSFAAAMVGCNVMNFFLVLTLTANNNTSGSSVSRVNDFDRQVG